jgi:hypothetical protein
MLSSFVISSLLSTSTPVDPGRVRRGYTLVLGKNTDKGFGGALKDFPRYSLGSVGVFPRTKKGERKI